MDEHTTNARGGSERPDHALEREFESGLDRLEQARPFAKGIHQTRVLAVGAKLMRAPGGIEVLYRHAPRFDRAGLFVGGDWDHPDKLLPTLVRATLLADDATTPVECLSELRLLAIASGAVTHPDMTASGAREFLEQVLGHNLDLLFPEATEVTRLRGPTAERIRRLFEFIVDRIGATGILTALVAECERVLLQRPIMVQRVADMLRAAARALPGGLAEEGQADDPAGEIWLIDALRGPTPLARRAPRPAAYLAALEQASADTVAQEAAAMGQRMDDTGLVSPPHAVLLRYLSEHAPELLDAALALDRIGQTSLAEHRPLIRSVIDRAVLPETARCVYGLSRLLNRGILFVPPVPPGLQQLMVLPIQPSVGQKLRQASGLADPPDANALLLAGTLSVIGQPRGVDQGHNPTCQAARAISLWSQNDVGFLLDLTARAARDDDVVMHFEGEPIRSSELPLGLAETLHTELDAVSLLLTPHLDKIYMEMSRRTADRDEDGHKWINPELHGWWVYRSFASLIDAGTGAVIDFDGFVRGFYAAYHPAYNGGRALVYAQPCGVVSTTVLGEFVGWHAVSIQRIARDPTGAWRVYFFNPNRDKGQDWGQDIVTSTCDHGEYEGESSLPFEQFAMRLYVFHYRQRDAGDPAAVPAEAIAEIRQAVGDSWASGFAWTESETSEAGG